MPRKSTPPKTGVKRRLEAVPENAVPESSLKRAPRAIANKILLPPAAFFSFLKDTRGVTVWTLHDFAETLGLASSAAVRALAVLEMQGYVHHTRHDEWITTPEGETISGSKFPRFSRAFVEQSLACRHPASLHMTRPQSADI
jgi:hypothetical protein